jgi:hypothetical protein
MTTVVSGSQSLHQVLSHILTLINTVVLDGILIHVYIGLNWLIIETSGRITERKRKTLSFTTAGYFLTS